ncbi:MAG TPA: hypothetical protein VGF17_09620 [Phytomonospora sp.]
MAEPTTPALPVLVPSAAAVQAAAEAMNPVLPLPIDSDAGVVAYYRQLRANAVLKSITAAAPHLVGDIFEWAFTNHKALGLSACADQLLELAVAARTGSSPEDPFAGLG